MIDPRNVLRLNLPLWQGGDNPDYYIGGRVLSAIAPDPEGPVETIAVPPPADSGARPVSAGIRSREVNLAILDQVHAAIGRHNPDAIVTLGGDCLVNLGPVSYLNSRYRDDLAVIWIDAHPDIMTAGQYPNAHAHLLAMLMGEGDADFVATVPNRVKPENVLYVGLTETTPYETDFITKHGIARLSPEDLQNGVAPVTAWLKARGLKHAAIHFDLDVLDPGLYDFLLFRNPSARSGAFDGVAKGRMSLSQIQQILLSISSVSDIVGLAITEYLPWSVIELSRELRKLPLLGNAGGAR